MSERMRESVKRRQLTYPMFRRTAGGANDAKSQASLEMGSEEYREYARDLAGVDEKEFVGASLVVDPDDARGRKVSDEEQEREAAHDMGEEAPHVADLAGDLAKSAEVQAETGADVAERKHIRRMAKSAHVEDMKQALKESAARTSTQKDDVIAESVSKRTVDDLPDIHDDNVTEEEYVPLARRRYF